MIKINLIRKFSLFFLLTFLASCSENKVTSPDDATFLDNRYENNFFGLHMELPAGWYTSSRDAMAEMSKTGRDLLAGDDKNLNASLKAAEKNVYNLFQAFQAAPGSPLDSYNSNITCIAEKVGHLPGIKSGEDYLLLTKQVLLSGQVEIKIDDAILNQDLGGKEFSTMHATLFLMGNEIEQDYYAMLENGYVLTFVTNHVGYEQGEKMKDMMSSIQFN